MEYQVPQFIDVEDKIVGPLTLRQFIYLTGGAGFSVATFLYFPFFLWVLVGPPIAALALALAFYKMNGKPFVEILEAAFSFYVKGRFFLRSNLQKETGGRGESGQREIVSPRAQNATRATPKLTSGKLEQLAWSLDIKNKEQALGSRDFGISKNSSKLGSGA